jgi:hypothetical protein
VIRLLDKAGTRLRGRLPSITELLVRNIEFLVALSLLWFPLDSEYIGWSIIGPDFLDKRSSYWTCYTAGSSPNNSFTA